MEFKNVPCRVSCPVSGALLVSTDTGSTSAITGTLWIVTGEFTRWGGHIAALWAGNVQLPWLTSKRRLARGGRIIAGFGACLGLPADHGNVLGALIGVKPCLLPFLRTPLRLDTEHPAHYSLILPARHDVLTCKIALVC